MLCELQYSTKIMHMGHMFNFSTASVTVGVSFSIHGIFKK